MKTWEFYRLYSNVPLAEREKEIDAGPSGKFTLAEIYAQIHNLEDYIRPCQIQIDNLMDIAEKRLNETTLAKT
jgi:hypothetical protein